MNAAVEWFVNLLIAYMAIGFTSDTVRLRRRPPH